MKDESGLKMNSMDHIPQTLASHSQFPVETQTSRQHGADMLKPDPRDTFFRSEPLSDDLYRCSSSLYKSCTERPTYMISNSYLLSVSASLSV